ncbi:MAG: nucleotidyltransferase family protein [Bacillota bacterium]|nr:nucleotidyltransferase family protein [Bacillota bacterium]
MNISAVICEFNPFHKGHEYLLQKMRNEGVSHIIAIMSGDFTQRGDCAAMNKFARAKAAVLCGADLVIELPTVWAMSGAETFARGGVQIANSLNCVDSLFFGSECGDENQLIKISNFILEENEKIKEKIKTGNYYARAVTESVRETLGDEYADILMSPNNTLGIEYINALKKTESKITPKTIKRFGAEHNSDSAVYGIASASMIRNLINENLDNVKNYLPDACFEVLMEEISLKRASADISNIERAILGKLRTMNKEELSYIAGVNEGLENRIFDAIKTETSLNLTIEKIKTKRYIHARIRRILLSAFLGITRDFSEGSVPYLRILAFNEKGTELMKIIKKNSNLPMITKPSCEIQKLDSYGKSIFNINLIASDLYQLSTPDIQPCGLDFSIGTIKL